VTGSDTLFTVIDRYVAQCCSLETPPRVSELAQLMGVSACTLGRQARRDHGISIAEALKNAQLWRAKRMLQWSDATTTQVAYACGFGTRRTFFRAFQRAVGMTPAQYRAAAITKSRARASDAESASSKSVSPQRHKGHEETLCDLCVFVVISL